MNSNNRQNFRPTQREIDDVTKRSRKDAFRGSVVGGIVGALAGGKFKKKLAGAVVGGAAGNAAGRLIGRREGARDVIQSRKALLQSNALAAINEKLNHLEDRAGHTFDRSGNAMEPGASGQHPVRLYPKAKGPYVPGNGIDDQEAYEMSPLRQKLIEIYGIGIVSALDDSELSEANCRRLRDQVLGRQSRADGPNAGGDRDPSFERDVLVTHLGAKVVDAMSPAEIHCHVLSAQRRGLIEMTSDVETTDFTLINRTRNGEGEFAPEGQVTSQSIQAAYSPTRRKTGIETGAVAGAGLAAAGALAHFRKSRRAKVRALPSGGSALTKAIGADFARGDDDQQGHGVRNAAIAAGAGVLGAAALFRKRKAKLRLPLGVPKIDNAIDVESQALEARLPLLTQLAMGKVGTYKIRRANLRGKRPPTGIHPRQLGKAKKHSLAFLIHDPDFPIVPMKQPKLPKGMRQRVKPALTRREVIERLKKITALSSHEFTGGLGKVAAEGIIDATGIGSLAGETPAQRRARQQRIQAQQQNAANDSDIANDSTAQPRTLDSALDRLANMNFAIGDAIARGAAKYLPEAAVIGSADLVAERANAGIEARKKRQKRLMRQGGGIQATPGMGTSPGVQTSMSAVHDTLLEFDHGNERTARAKRNGTVVGAAGVGGAAGAIGGMRYESGTPVSAKDLRPGDKIHKRFGPGGIFEHQGVVGSDGRVTHRTRGSANYRSVQASTFAKSGRGPIYREKPTSNDLPRKQAAANASSAAGTRAGKYCVGTNSCQTAVGRLASKGRPSGQLRRAGIGGAIGALGGATVAEILNHKNRKDK